ncbi:zinc finger protein 595-like [Culex pipiens pallens]|uniref:zinc finger protein 595-like n=1 Tax=Culex pipiens pallens TaxID=42434 RepID=UPI001953F337|nr:zinc finger protein 595-like [Culex pipiens pallens]
MEEVYFEQNDDDGPPELDGDTVEYVEEADLISESAVDERDFVYNCNACNMTFHSVEDHIRVHHREEQVMVEVEEEVEGSRIDEKVFGFKEVSDEDEVIDAGNDFKCTVCHTLLKNARSLKLHMKMHDPKKIGVHIRNQSENHCQPCNRSFSDSKHFLLHMAGHENNEFETEQPDPGISAENNSEGYPCSYCGKRFKRPYEKVKHERVHSGERPYSCEVCGKRFRVSSCLAVHRRTHDDTRPFVCPHCKKSFKIPSVYNHHLKTHSDARPYQCPLCPKAFKTAVSLHGHRKTHTKPFPCGECGRPFGSLYQARKHVEQVHHGSGGGKASHGCGICGAVYGRAAALKEHLRDVHGTMEVVEEECIVMEEEVDCE